MTTILPTPLSCLTLAHIINDRDAVEGFLSQDPSAASCFPLILRDLFFNSERNTKWGLNPLGIPDAKTTLDYLRVLWSFTDDPYLNILNAAVNGATYILPWLVPEGLRVKSGDWRGLPIYGWVTASPPAGSELQKILTLSLIKAVRANKFDTAQLLHDMGAESDYPSGTHMLHYSKNIEFPRIGVDLLRELTMSGGTQANISAVLFLLELEPTREDAKAHVVRNAFRDAVRVGTIEMLDALIGAYPQYLTRPVYNELITWARDVNQTNSQKVLGWLREYAAPRIYKS